MNIDVTVIKDGWHGDTSKMFLVGKTQTHNERLVQITQECLYRGIEVVKPGARLGDIGHAIQSHAEKNHYSVVEEYCGHGIGKIYHDEPQILHYGIANTGQEIVEGMCFTIEPMINIGSKSTKLLSDGWTVETRDGRNSAQWEHTIYVNKDGAEILTLRKEESTTAQMLEDFIKQKESDNKDLSKQFENWLYKDRGRQIRLSLIHI